MKSKLGAALIIIGSLMFFSDFITIPVMFFSTVEESPKEVDFGSITEKFTGFGALATILPFVGIGLIIIGSVIKMKCSHTISDFSNQISTSTNNFIDRIQASRKCTYCGCNLANNENKCPNCGASVSKK